MVAQRYFSRFAGIHRSGAWSILLSYIAVTAACLTIALSESRVETIKHQPPPGKGDIRLYWDEVRRMQRGEGYYAAAKLELERQGFPTASVFNWRTPLPMWLLARLPNPAWGRVLIAGAALTLGFLTFHVLRKESGAARALAGAALVVGSVAPCFAGEVFILPLEWGTVCIGLSICCYGLERRGAAIGLGILGAVFRELALGYSLLMALVAIYERRTREVCGWLLGLGVFAAFYGWHGWMVSLTIGETDVIQAGSWVEFGGLPFLVATAQMHSFLLPLPQWVTAIYLPTALLGLAGWSSRLGNRVALVVGTYSALFLVVGQPFNQYWGLLTAPLLALGAAAAPQALTDLARALRGARITSAD